MANDFCLRVVIMPLGSHGVLSMPAAGGKFENFCSNYESTAIHTQTARKLQVNSSCTPGAFKD